MSVTTQNKGTKKVQGQKEQTAQKSNSKAVAKVQKAVPVDPFAELMAKLNKIDELRGYYNKLKVKRDGLRKAYDKMQTLTKSGNKFENEDEKEFPFEIVLKGENEYNRSEELFKISKRETVATFTKLLLDEITDVLTIFEEDIKEETKKIDA